MKPSHTLLYYVVLGMLLTSGVFSFLASQGNQPLQLAVSVITAVGYILWGLLYHGMRRDLHLKVVVEYVLVSSIAVILVSIALYS